MNVSVSVIMKSQELQREEVKITKTKQQQKSVRHTQCHLKGAQKAAESFRVTGGHKQRFYPRLQQRPRDLSGARKADLFCVSTSGTGAHESKPWP